MKTSRLQKLAWVFFALALTTTTVFAQVRGNGNRTFQNQNGACLNNISGLSEKQEKQIIGMEETHQNAMAELRTKRRSTSNAIEKSEIRTEMLKKVEAHRNSVTKVLNADQLKQYDQLHASGNKGRNQQFGNGRGNRNYQGRGNGNRQFAQGNNSRACYSNANSRGRGGNLQNGNGRRNSNRNYYQNSGNNFRGQNANYNGGMRNGYAQRGNGRFQQQDSCTVHGSRNISDEGFEVIE